MRNHSARTLNNEAEIDMTPMLDIVFIMLIFFIVTASFLKESGLPLNVPENSPPTTKDRVSLILQVSESNEVLFGARRIDIRAVGANLKRKMSELDNPSVVVRAHPGARTDTLMQVVDRVRDAGVHDFIVSPIKE